MSFTRYRVFLQFIVTFAVLACVPTLYFLNEHAKIDKRALQTVEQNNIHKLEYAKAELQVSVDQIITAASSLSNNGLLHQAILNPTQENLQNVSYLWLLVAKTQGVYSQLRFIDSQGMEKIRINTSEFKSEIVAPNDLQYKGDRKYFAYAQSLQGNQVGTYGIDLESEYGELTTPLTLGYRVIVPIELQGERKGYFIANLDLKRIYRSLAYKRNNNNLPTIFNGDGYYILPNDGTRILGNIINEHKEYSLSKQYPSLWRRIQLTNSGTVKEGSSWYSFIKTDITHTSTKEPLIFVLESDLSDIQPIANEERRELNTQAVFLLIIIALITFSFITWNYNHEKNSMASKIARAAMNGMSAVVITDHNNRIIQVNEQFTKSSGYTLEEVKGKQPTVFSSGRHNQEFYMNMWKALENEGIWEGEVVNKRRDGSLITEILRIQTVTDKQGTIQFYVASFIDISHRKALEDQLRELSEKDPLSGLWNRRKFDTEMVSHSQRIKRYPDSEHVSLALIDIDHFKRINDKYGHDIGDKVIGEVAQTLSTHLRETDIIARIGGEEFAIIMPHTPLDEAEVVVNRLRTAVNLESDLNITVSGGVTDICSKPGDSYKRADIALYESKTLGRNQVNVMASAEANSIA